MTHAVSVSHPGPERGVRLLEEVPQDLLELPQSSGPELLLLDLLLDLVVQSTEGRSSVAGLRARFLFSELMFNF